MNIIGKLAVGLGIAAVGSVVALGVGGTMGAKAGYRKAGLTLTDAGSLRSQMYMEAEMGDLTAQAFAGKAMDGASQALKDLGYSGDVK